MYQLNIYTLFCYYALNLVTKTGENKKTRTILRNKGHNVRSYISKESESYTELHVEHKRIKSQTTLQKSRLTGELIYIKGTGGSMS